MTPADRPFRSGYVAILGKPNVGKSTLMNLFLGEKVSIVTSKPGTTRDKIIGILTRPEAQAVFVDTPGLHEPKIALGRHMVRQARSSLEEADLAVLMTDAANGIGPADQQILAELSGAGIPVIMAINKADLVNKGRILPIIEEAARLFAFKSIVPLSCRTGENVETLLKLILGHLPEGAPYFTEDELTDRTLRYLAGERIREKVLVMLQQEVPHSVAVVVEEMKDREEKDLCFVRATVIVEKESQKAILIGKKGLMLKKIGSTSREELEKLLEKKVFLELWVKVMKNWRKDDRVLKRLGF